MNFDLKNENSSRIGGCVLISPVVDNDHLTWNKIAWSSWWFFFIFLGRQRFLGKPYIGYFSGVIVINILQVHDFSCIHILYIFVYPPLQIFYHFVSFVFLHLRISYHLKYTQCNLPVSQCLSAFHNLVHGTQSVR